MKQSKPLNSPVVPAKVIAIVGPSNSGKTELICRLVGWFEGRGLAVAVLKHSHKLNLGDQGKDTGRYHGAGAVNVALAAPGLLQITRFLPEDPPVEQVLTTWAPDADLILVEGYKSGSLPKIALVGSKLEKVISDYSQVVALVSPEAWDSPLPVFAPHQVAELGRFIQEFLSVGKQD